MSSLRRLGPFLAVLAVLAVAGCAHDGRTLRDPLPGATTVPTPVTTASTARGSDDAVIGTPAPAETMLLASTAFVNGDPLPANLTCDNPTSSSPPLAWTGIPSGTAELALTLTDPDAGGYVHWAVVGIPVEVRSLDAGRIPESAVELVNDAATVGWTPPCPPAGAKAHRYLFTLYALGQRSGIAAGTTARAALTTINADAFSTTVLAATYERK